MILLVISDLHIDTGKKLGTFGWKAKAFMSTLDRVIEHYGVEKVILNPDPSLELRRHRERPTH